MAIAAGFLLAPTDKAHAQVAVSIGAAPVCPYGYYEAPPYNCAPDGYYGPEWSEAAYSSARDLGITGRLISTATSIINSTIAKGYHGAMPVRGAAPAAPRAEVRGEAMHDVHGHEAP